MLSKLLCATALSICIFHNSNATDKLYVGGSFGNTSSTSELTRNFVAGTNDRSTLGGSTPSFGAFVGYNNSITQTPLFIGLEGGVLNHRLEIPRGENTFPPYVNYLTSAKTDNAFFGTFRVGLVIKDLLLYIKTGFSSANWRVKFQNNGNPANASEVVRKFSKTGFIKGAGIDYRLNDSWLMGVEYTNYDYGALRISHALGDFKITPKLHTTTARLVYTF